MIGSIDMYVFKFILLYTKNKNVSTYVIYCKVGFFLWKYLRKDLLRWLTAFEIWLFFFNSCIKAYCLEACSYIVIFNVGQYMYIYIWLLSRNTSITLWGFIIMAHSLTKSYLSWNIVKIFTTCLNFFFLFIWSQLRCWQHSFFCAFLHVFINWTKLTCLSLTY